jgi:hypothetical protein
MARHVVVFGSNQVLKAAAGGRRWCTLHGAAPRCKCFARCGL